MSAETQYRYLARSMALKAAAMQASDDLLAIEGRLERILDDSNPNKDTIIEIKNALDLAIRARAFLSEAIK